MPKRVYLEGKRFGLLVVSHKHGSGPHGDTQWQCLCDCGNTSIVLTRHLSGGTTVSCGCYRRSIHTKHGHASRSPRSDGNRYSPEYRTWMGMRDRCRNKAHRAYVNYGGRGITVCDRWNDYANFIMDMGPKPTSKHSLDRIDCNKGYSPENCKWSTAKEQGQNKRNTVLLTLNGQTMNMSEWAKSLGVNPTTIRFRIDAGMPIEKILFAGRLTAESNKNRNK